MTVQLKRNVPGFRDANGVFHPLRSASYIPSGKGRRKATTRDKKKYSRAKAGDLGKARQERALEDPWDRENRLEREAAARLKRDRDRLEREIERDIYGETSGRTSRGKARSLVQFVRSEGGINTKFRLRRGQKQIGDLANYTLKDSGKRGLVTTTPGKGKGLDGMWQAAREAGYDVTSEDDLLARLDSEIAGGPATYSTHGYMAYNPKAKKNPDAYIIKKGTKWIVVTREGNQFGRDLQGRIKSWKTAAGAAAWCKRQGFYGGYTILKQNPDPVSTFASLAWGIASSLHIKEMLTKPTARKAAKRRGTTTAKTKKRTNPAWPSDVEHKVASSGSKAGLEKVLQQFYMSPSIRIEGNAAYNSKGIISSLKLANKGSKWFAYFPKGKTNPAPSAKRSKGPKGDLYVLTIGSGDDLISVYLHDGDKDGFSKRFKTMAAAKAYATKSKVKLVSNPAAAKVNGIISRAWARSRAKAEYARELRLAAAAERSRKRRSKFEGKARSNPASKHYTVKGTKNGRRVQFFTKAATPAAAIREVEKYQGEIKNAKASIFTDKMASAWFAARGDKMRIARAKSNPTNPRSAAGKKAVAHASNGKKAVARSAKANPKNAKTDLTRAKQLVRNMLAGKLGLFFSWSDIDKRLAFYKFSPSIRKAAIEATKASRHDFPKATAVERFKIRKSIRKNPKTTARRRTFEMFQGRKATTAKAMPVSRLAPANLDQLGDLVEIKLHGGKTIKFNPRKFKLTAAGGKLWIAGGTFTAADNSVPAHVINPVAEIDHVVYGTRKPHHGDHAYTHYIHKLGEESGKRPILCVDREGFPVIRGGNYKIEARGIVD